MAATNTLATLPVAIHSQAMSRLSTADLAQFETVLATADEAIEACMNANASVHVPVTDEGTVGVLKSVVNTVRAVTGATPPASLDSKEELCKWTARAIYEFRDRAVNAAVTNNLTRGMPPEQMSACLELIEKLNRTIGGV